MIMHDCPIDGCQQRVPHARLMCHRHWSMVPSRLGRAVYEAWDRGRGRGTEEHESACERAIEAVHRKLGVLP